MEAILGEYEDYARVFRVNIAYYARLEAFFGDMKMMAAEAYMTGLLVLCNLLAGQGGSVLWSFSQKSDLRRFVRLVNKGIVFQSCFQDIEKGVSEPPFKLGGSDTILSSTGGLGNEGDYTVGGT